MGSESDAGGFTLHVRLPRRADVRIVRDGVEFARVHSGTSLDAPAHEPGVYRVEATLLDHGRPRSWVVSNPIYLRGLDGGRRRCGAGAAAVPTGEDLADRGAPPGAEAAVLSRGATIGRSPSCPRREPDWSGRPSARRAGLAVDRPAEPEASWAVSRSAVTPSRPRCGVEAGDLDPPRRLGVSRWSPSALAGPPGGWAASAAVGGGGVGAGGEAGVPPVASGCRRRQAWGGGVAPLRLRGQLGLPLVRRRRGRRPRRPRPASGQACAASTGSASRAATAGGVSRRYHSASSAALQPEPAAVIAWR